MISPTLFATLGLRPGNPGGELTLPSGAYLHFRADDLLGTYNDGDPVFTLPNNGSGLIPFQWEAGKQMTFRTNRINGLPVLEAVNGQSYIMNTGNGWGEPYGMHRTVLAVTRHAQGAVFSSYGGAGWECQMGYNPDNHDVWIGQFRTDSGWFRNPEWSSSTDKAHVGLWQMEEARLVPEPQYRMKIPGIQEYAGYFPFFLYGSWWAIGAGASNMNFAGELAELIFYPRTLSAEESGQATAYLNTKYNLS